jgi:hypothetical protein
LLPATVAVAALGRALVLLASLSFAGLVAQLPALLAAIALPPIVPDTDPKRSPAPKTRDLDEVNWFRARHTAGEAELDNDRCEWEALSVTRQSFRLSASTARSLLA